VKSDKKNNCTSSEGGRLLQEFSFAQTNAIVKQVLILR